MKTSVAFRRLFLVSGGVAFLLAAMYGLMGFFQAVMLFNGERALRNSNIWGSVFLIALALSMLCFAASRSPQTARAPYRDHIRGVLLLVCLVLSASAGWRVVSDFLEVDACLDRGGSFDYVRSVCDQTGTHASVSLFAWRGFFLTCALVFGVPVVLASLKHRTAKGVAHAP